MADCHRVGHKGNQTSSKGLLLVSLKFACPDSRNNDSMKSTWGSGPAADLQGSQGEWIAISMGAHDVRRMEGCTTHQANHFAQQPIYAPEAHQLQAKPGQPTPKKSLRWAPEEQACWKLDKVAVGSRQVLFRTTFHSWKKRYTFLTYLIYPFFKRSKWRADLVLSCEHMLLFEHVHDHSVPLLWWMHSPNRGWN